MKTLVLLTASLATAKAFSLQNAIQQVIGSDSTSEKRLIETNPGETRYVFEEEKWVLKRVIRITTA